MANNEINGEVLYEQFIDCMENLECNVRCPKCNHPNNLYIDIVKISNFHVCTRCKDYKFMFAKCDNENCYKRIIVAKGRKTCILHYTDIDKIVLSLDVVFDLISNMNTLSIDATDNAKIEPVNNNYISANSLLKHQQSFGNNIIHPILQKIDEEISEVSYSTIKNDTKKKNESFGNCDAIVVSRKDGSPCGKPAKCINSNGEPRCGMHSRK